jgi:phosphoribosylaminoimidazole carboxylase
MNSIPGGGQLGRMLAAAASLLNVKIVILDIGSESPAKQVISPSPSLSHIDGSFTDPEKILELASKVDILTVEIEHVDADVLEEVQRRTKVQVHPSPSAIKIIQDKFLQKEHLSKSGIPLPEYMKVESTVDALRNASAAYGFPFMLKSRTLAYDGRGNYAVRNQDQISDAISVLANRPLYAERWVPFDREIAVLVVRNTQGDVLSYPAVETVHKDNICHLVFAPIRTLDSAVEVRALTVAENTVKTFSGAGVFAVEMFLLRDGKEELYFLMISLAADLFPSCLRHDPGE